jgi:hypothetical protein
MNNAITADMNTAQLFEATNAALCAGAFSLSVKLLDELSLCSDNRDMLAPAASYGVPAHIAGIVQDRIDLVNSKAEGY